MRSGSRGTIDPPILVRQASLARGPFLARGHSSKLLRPTPARAIFCCAGGPRVTTASPGGLWGGRQRVVERAGREAESMGRGIARPGPFVSCGPCGGGLHLCYRCASSNAVAPGLRPMTQPASICNPMIFNFAGLQSTISTAASSMCPSGSRARASASCRSRRKGRVQSPRAILLGSMSRMILAPTRTSAARLIAT